MRLTCLCLLPLVLLVLALPGIVRADDDPVPGPRPPDEGAERPTPPRAGTPAPLRLVRAGATPRRPLRYAPRAGRYRTTFRQVIAPKLGGLGMDATTLPATVVEQRLQVGAAKPDGRFTVEGEVTDARLDGAVPPDVGPRLEEALDAAKGLKTRFLLTARGEIEEARVEGAGAPPPDLAQRMARCLAALPEEPVGIGAAWEHGARMSAGGLALDMALEVRLVAHEGSRVTLEERIAITSAAKTLRSPAGTEIPVRSVTGQGKGRLVLDLARGITEREALELKVSVALAVEGEEMKMEMDVRMEMRTKPRAPQAQTPGGK